MESNRPMRVETVRLRGKRAVVTGATAGIGLYTALALARQGAALIITGRDPKRLATAMDWIRSRMPGTEIEAEQADFASLSEVRAMGERIFARHPRIDILINNAGLIMPKRVMTVDGFETTFQVNHLAPFLLTGVLLPALKAAAPSRIVTVSSMASRAGHIHFDDLNLAAGYGMWKAYCQSKLANIMFTRGLDERLMGSGVTANAVHPGFVASNFGNKGPFGAFLWALLRPLQITQTKGAENSVFAAVSPEMEGVSGQYLVKMKSARSNPLSYDRDAVEHMWRVSAEMTKLES